MAYLPKLFQLVCGVLLVATNTKLFFAHGAATIDPSLNSRFFSGEKQSVMVSFTQGIEPVIERINRQNFSSMNEKRTALTNAQQAFTNGAQGPLQNFLNIQGVKYESFWINNKMIIPNADSGLVNAVSTVPGVAKIEKEPMYTIEPPTESRNGGRFGRADAPSSWGIQKIRAEPVWDTYDGTGIVVANIDTGVQYTHESLRDRWRSEYGWFDPYTKGSLPIDENGHGTHTMGTIAGSKGIGVAPGATWIACRGCDKSTCGGSQLMACGQWIQCPTKPDGKSDKDCSKAPHVVSNSWGGGQGDTSYRTIIRSWKAAGIIPVFSIGNSGRNGCGSANSPGDLPDVIGVGSTDSRERISSFSSLGPSTRGTLKPDIAAPGGQIRSAGISKTSNSAYSTMSGTSMACPHVAGMIALMRQKKLSLTYDQVYEALKKSAVTSSLDTSTAKSCGGVNRNTFPNNVFGYGRIDAVNAVNNVN